MSFGVHHIHPRRCVTVITVTLLLAALLACAPGCSVDEPQSAMYFPGAASGGDSAPKDEPAVDGESISLEGLDWSFDSTVEAAITEEEAVTEPSEVLDQPKPIEASEASDPSDPSDPPESAPDGNIYTPAFDGPAKASDVVALLEELTALHDEVQVLEQRLAMHMESVEESLRTENRHLRAELERAYQAQGAPALEIAEAPRPGQDIFAEIRKAALEALDSKAADPASRRAVQSEAPAPAVDLTKALPSDSDIDASEDWLDISGCRYVVITEWGRAPDAVRGDAESLKGMVCAVPGNVTPAQLMALGQGLRAKFADYQNINIEVFNSPIAARRYADTGVGLDESRVLSIAKQASANRDTINLLGSETVFEVPLEEGAARRPVEDEESGGAINLDVADELTGLPILGE